MTLLRTTTLTIGGVEYNVDLDGRDVEPTAYAPATLTRTRQTGLDDQDPARFTVDVTVPASTLPNAFNDPSFEAGIDDVVYNPSNTSIVHSAFENAILHGSMALSAITTDTPNAFTAVGKRINGDTGSVAPGQWVSAVMPVRSSGWSGRTRARILWYDASNANIGDTPGAYIDVISGAYSYPAVTAQAPAGTAWARAYVYLNTTDGTAPPPDSTAHFDAWRAAVADTQAAAEAGVSWFHEGDGLPQLGDPVVVGVAATNTLPVNVPIFFGQVESMRRLHRTFRLPDGSTFDATVYRIDAVDAFGLLSRRKIGDTPWPREFVYQRWENRLTPLLPEFPLAAYGGSVDDEVAPRDVDNVSALEVMWDTLRLADMTMIINAVGEIDPQPRADVLGEDYAVWPPHELPAHAFESPEDVIDYDLMVNAGQYTGKRLDGTEWVESSEGVVDNTLIARYGESRVSWSGDGLTSHDAYTPPLGFRLDHVITGSGQPSWRLDGQVQLIPHLLDPETDDLQWLNDLIDLGTAQMPVVKFIGAPPGRDVFRVIGFALTWGSDAVEALALDVEPVPLAGTPLLPD